MAFLPIFHVANSNGYSAKGNPQRRYCLIGVRYLAIGPIVEAQQQAIAETIRSILSGCRAIGR